MRPNEQAPRDTGTLPAQSLGDICKLQPFRYLLSLKLVGGYYVCNWHNLLSVHWEEVLGDILRERRQAGRLRPERRQEQGPGTVGQGPGRPGCAQAFTRGGVVSQEAWVRVRFCDTPVFSTSPHVTSPPVPVQLVA